MQLELPLAYITRTYLSHNLYVIYKLLHCLICMCYFISSSLVSREREREKHFERLPYTYTHIQILRIYILKISLLRGHFFGERERERDRRERERETFERLPYIYNMRYRPHTKYVYIYIPKISLLRIFHFL